MKMFVIREMDHLFAGMASQVRCVTVNGKNQGVPPLVPGTVGDTLAILTPAEVASIERNESLVRKLRGQLFRQCMQSYAHEREWDQETELLLAGKIELLHPAMCQHDIDARLKSFREVRSTEVLEIENSESLP